MKFCRGDGFTGDGPAATRDPIRLPHPGPSH